MKKYEDLTPTEINKLRKSGLLETIYPEAKNEFALPKEVENPDWSSVTELAKEYAQKHAQGQFYKSDDYQHFIWEEVMKTVYGNDYFDWHNKIDD